MFQLNIYIFHSPKLNYLGESLCEVFNDFSNDITTDDDDNAQLPEDSVGNLIFDGKTK